MTPHDSIAIPPYATENLPSPRQFFLSERDGVVSKGKGKIGRTRRKKAPPAKLVLERLAASYGPREWYSRAEPLDELIQTVLAQHTSDTNAERAFRELWKTFGSWPAITNADVDAIADSIRSGGLAR